MKFPSAFVLIWFCLGITSGCKSPSSGPANEAASPPLETQISEDSAEPVTELPQIESFTTDELFEAGGGGCGMSLWSEASEVRSFLLFNGVDDDSMLMKIDGEFVKFRRTDFAGEAFYGQYPSQTFLSEDGTIRVEVNIKQGAAGEIESVAISEGRLRLERDGNKVEFAVAGDAGC